MEGDKAAEAKQRLSGVEVTLKTILSHETGRVRSPGWDWVTGKDLGPFHYRKCLSRRWEKDYPPNRIYWRG